MICHLYPEPAYLIFSSETPELLYYSHIPVSILALCTGLFILLNGRSLLQNRLIFFIFLCFSLWTSVNLFLWTGIQSELLVFAWSFLAVLGSFISVLSIYFMYVFLDKKDVTKSHKIVFLLLLAPVLLFGHTNLSLSGFDLTYCDAFNFEGTIYKIYNVVIAVIAFVWIGILCVTRYLKSGFDERKQILLMGTGIEFFLLLFFSMVYLASYLATIGVFQDSELEMIGLLGMLVFIVFIGVLMVQFKTFRAGLLASQALIFGLVILVSSQFTFVSSSSGKILVSITLILTAAVGITLSRSIRKEITQKHQIEGLVEKLERANLRLRQIDKLKSEFVSIASHQLRSPLTSISGYASLLREGNYGQLPEAMLEPVDRIEQSARLMAQSVEDYLNVSRIESGNMKYTMADFNLRTEAEHICDDQRPEALRKGLVILFRSSLTSQGIVHADLNKTQQIIHNLLNNALKYTPKGTVTIHLFDNLAQKKIYLEIIDSGIGMNQETLGTIFQKFERGDTANKVNVKGTGLGLYVALKMAEAMGGTITAHSDGEDKGSRFTLELPLMM